MDEEFSSALLTGCVLLASRCWALPCKTCRAIRPPHADQPAAEGEPRRAPAPTNERSWRAPGLSWSATRSSWPLPNHLPQRQPGPNRRLRWPSTTCASFEHEAPTQADDEPGMDAAGDHANSGHPSRNGGLPTPRSRTSLRPDTADAATHRHRTPRPDAGQRTPDSGHRPADTWTLRRPHRTLDTGHVDRQAWTLVARTGHRTPDTGRGRGQVTTARPASGPPEPPRRATARWDAQPCSCGRAPAALDSPCRLGGEAAFQREIAPRRQLLGRSARVERRLGALLSLEDFGSSVERTATLHPL
jgi:hypothetical protein